MEKVFLVGVNLNQGEDFALSMSELESLAQACDMCVVGSSQQNMECASSATYIGSGKVEEVKAAAEMLEADVIIFDNGLSPIQLRNLQDALGKPVMDRTTLILEIFSSRAKTKEAKLQVEVARLQYMLPRLVGLHDALSRQGGGSGAMSNKGAGEKKIELDRRRLEQRLTSMKRELSTISEEREVQRKKRALSGIPRVALVGYTNAGKSTIMNMFLSASIADEEKQVFEKDMLFATLDTTVRRIDLPDYKPFLLSDTVGFISKLPHNLIKAFRSTLEEAREADLLIQVIDYSDEYHREYMKVTEDTLRELDADKIPMIYVFNKSDLCGMGTFAMIQGDDKIFMSAKSGEGIEALLKLIEGKLAGDYQDCTFLIPYQRGDIVSYLNTNAQVQETQYREDGVFVKANVRKSDAGKYQEYAVAQE